MTRTLTPFAQRDNFLKQFYLILCAITLFWDPALAQSTPTPTPSPTPYECIGTCGQDSCIRFAPPDNGTGNCVSLSESCVKCSCDPSSTDQVICEAVSIMRYVSGGGACLLDSLDTFTCRLAPPPLKLIADDKAGGDQLGISVVVSGVTAIVGSIMDADKGAKTGSVYIFDTSNQTQLRKLTASDGASNDQFGQAVALSGTTVIVTATGDTDRGSRSGSAYIFDINGTELRKLTASDGAANDYFGQSVAASGWIAVVGAYLDDTPRGADSGSAYIFDTRNGTQLRKLTANDGAKSDCFGQSVSISGTTVLVGAYGKADTRGAAYIFDVSSSTQLRKLLSSDGATGDFFGYAVAVSDTMAVVGACEDDDRGSSSGSAYIFDVSTGAELRKLTASDGSAVEFFARSVAIDGTMMIIGAYKDSDRGDSSGSAYIFNATSGKQLLKLTASDGSSSDYFGNAVAISGMTAVVGAYQDDIFSSNEGSVYVFDLI